MVRLISIAASLALCFSKASSAISRQECLAQGGEIVGDIGNGAIFLPDYVCVIDGLPPTDVVVAGFNEPIAIEGEVCCGGNGTGIEDMFGSDGNITSLLDNSTMPEISADECAATGGVLVQDMVNGSCPFTGEPPIGTVVVALAARSSLLISASQGGVQLCCPDSGGLARKEYTRQECVDKNGTIVGDIGNGAIFENDYYICDSNGLPPIANIAQDAEPFAIEGEVCCGEDTVRAEVSRLQCVAQGGEVVTDIGDGSSRSPGYLCQSNGEPPIANIVPAKGEPIAREGAVCCGTQLGSSNFATDGACFLSLATVLSLVPLLSFTLLL